MLANLLLIVPLWAPGVSHTERAQGTNREPVVGLPCEGCEAVFEGLPAQPASVARIAAVGDPGRAMRIAGTVRDERGRPVPGVIVYAYHTDSAGIYPGRGEASGAVASHGKLRGWARTDDQGRYRFDTIRPGGYPGRDTPEHVHMHVLEVGRCTYYLDDLLFEDDPRLTARMRAQLTHGRGGSGVAMPLRDSEGTWLVRRDIVLGQGIPGYPAEAAR